jgi:small subunit ribosomal protein S15
MDKQDKAATIKEFARSDKDVGSADVQIAVLTRRITHLTEHLKLNRKDHSSRRGLAAMVNRRRKLLSYLDRTAHARYLEMIQRLSLRH